ncbi:MAG TPA: hypothetical protein VLH36_13570, partial [Steroidobacteraceae bacterium]|nr:hypothetical protein [Steroidobacteraceae bacterium]
MNRCWTGLQPRESRSLRRSGSRIKGFVEDLAGARLAGAAAGSDAGAGLQLLERARTFLDGLAETLF